MSPAFIPSIKDLAGKVTIAQTEEVLQVALRFKTTSSVKKHMAEYVGEIAPGLKLFDVGQ